MRLQRRSFVTGVAGLSLGALGCDEAPQPTCAPVPAQPLVAVAACGAAFEELVTEIIDTPRAELRDRVAARLRGGLDLATLLAADFHAASRTLTPSAGGVIHALLVVSSANLVGAAVDPSLQLASVLWSLDNLKGEQELGQTPLPPLDEASLPGDATAARELLVAGVAGFDQDAADAGAAAMLRHGARDELVDDLLRYSVHGRGDEHRQIFPAQCFRSLDAFGWECAEPVVRFLARVLAEEVTDGTTATFDASVDLAHAGVDLGGTGRSPSLSLALLAASRSGGPDEMRAEVADMLAGGSSPEVVWDALLAASAEIVLRGNGGGGLHCFDAVNALRWGVSRTKSPELRALLLLQAAAFIPLAREAAKGAGWKYPPPYRELDIDRLEPGLAPESLEALFERGGTGRGNVYDTSAASDALAWFAVGGSECDFVVRARQLVVAKGSVDAHYYKFPAAVFEEIERVDPFWVPRFLATELLVNPSPTTFADWSGLDEALALAAELGLR